MRPRAWICVVLGAMAVGVAGAGAAAPAAPVVAENRGPAQLGLVGMDHVGITVPDIDAAVSWFERVLGCAAPLTFGPFSDPVGTFMQDLLAVDPRAVIEQITMVRCGRSANIELFEYEAPDQRTTFPRNSDWAGHHIAFYVKDIDAAVAHMQAHGVQKLLGPLAVTDGPAAGQTINYFRAPFGTYIELISYPKGMAYEQGPGKPLWSPKRNGLRPVVTSVPGLLGVDHVGITVPDVNAAVAWFEDVLGCRSPLSFGPFSDPTGTFMAASAWSAPPEGRRGPVVDQRRRRRGRERLFREPPPELRSFVATAIPEAANWSPCPRRAASRLTSPRCSGSTSVTPVPLRPARPVRPTRWT